MLARLKKAFFMLMELFMRLAINPFLRASLLRLCGANIGRNVRIYEIQLLNLDDGFKNLCVGNNVHIGMGCRIDLKGGVNIGHGSTISPGVTILTHADPGEYQRSPICNLYSPFVSGVMIGEHCWVGANTTILAGSKIGDKVVIGACSLVKGELESSCLYYGVPASKMKELVVD